LIRSRHAAIYLLQQNDVRIVILEDFDDAVGLKAAVEPDCSMDIVANDSKIQEFFYYSLRNSGDSLLNFPRDYLTEI